MKAKYTGTYLKQERQHRDIDIGWLGNHDQSLHTMEPQWVVFLGRYKPAQKKMFTLQLFEIQEQFNM